MAVGLNQGNLGDLKLDFLKDYNTLTYDLLGHGKNAFKQNLQVSFEDFSTQLA